MCNSQLSKSKSEIKNSTETILRLLSNVSGDSNGKTNFPHKSFLTSARVCRLRKAFAVNSLVNIKLSKNQLSNMIQLRGS